MTIGAKIKQARIDHGLTQEALGNLVGVQKSAIAKWETGRVENIKRSALAKLAEVLEMNPAELVGGSVENNVSEAMQEAINFISDMSEDEIAELMNIAKYVKSKRN